jgi:REP element-mobilizing transposase RayT
MAFVKIWVHAVWGTKNREPVLISELRKALFSHIRANAKAKNIYLDTMNGHTDHIHCLLSLNTDISISKTIQLLKGESAFWLNKQKLLKKRFEWADEYFAVSVSESMIDKVRAYILNQEEHHRKITFADEYASFMKKYKFLG